MKKNKFSLGILAGLTAFTLAACGENDESTNSSGEEMDMQTNSETEGTSEHSSMNHSSSGEVPEGLKPAENPTYDIGSSVRIQASHMEGMDGAEATVVGAFDTTVYAVSYTPISGGEKVTNHKWVIHEELENAGEAPLEPGEEISLAADHMEGMDGAEATIDAAEDTTVYMVDFTPTTGGEKMKNHMWVTESELLTE